MLLYNYKVNLILSPSFLDKTEEKHYIYPCKSKLLIYNYKDDKKKMSR